MLVPMTQLLQAAEEGGYALPGFSMCNLETIQAVVEAAEELDSPVVLCFAHVFQVGSPPGYLESLIQYAGERSRVPVASLLDHGKTMEICAMAIRQGFSAVMMDASECPFEENVAVTRMVVEFAHACGVAVEGAVGLIKHDPVLTDPDEAAEFVARTGVDALAVSVGEYSGFYEEEPSLDFERLTRIKELTKANLVLHGASGLANDVIRRTIELGISHIRIGTDLREAFFRTIEEMRQKHPNTADPRKILWPARDALREVAKEKIRAMGAAGKATGLLDSG